MRARGEDQGSSRRRFLRNLGWSGILATSVAVGCGEGNDAQGYPDNYGDGGGPKDDPYSDTPKNVNEVYADTYYDNFVPSPPAYFDYTDSYYTDSYSYSDSGYGDSSYWDGYGDFYGDSGYSDYSSYGDSSYGDFAYGDAIYGDGYGDYYNDTGYADYMDGGQAGLLTAGDWRDLDHWDLWEDLFTQGNYAGEEDRWGYYTRNRIAVLVVCQGEAVIDAKVKLIDEQDRVLWEERTDNQGRAELFPGLFGQEVIGPLRVMVVDEDERVMLSDVHFPLWDEPLIVDLSTIKAPQSVLDLMFVVDTTGSMGDELRYLQTELRDVIERIRQDQGQSLRIRLSVNFYRDVNDEYVVRSFPFSTDIDDSLEKLGRQRSAGGGDFEEAVEQALENAVSDHEWSTDAKARLLFLVLDAPPHHRPDIIGRLHELTAEAARKGIRIIAVTASGIDKDTEFLMRFLGVSTGATYVFLTDDSGIGGGHIEPTIGPHTVEPLNDLLVRLITDALS